MRPNDLGAIEMHIWRIFTTATSAAATVACMSLAAQAGATRYMGLYEESSMENCKKKNSCRVDFSIVTDHVRIEKVSCNIYSDDRASFTGILLGNLSRSTGELTEGQYLAPPTLIFQDQKVKQYQFLLDTLHVVPKTWKPSILFNFDQNTNATAHCTIHGTENS
jgi:hypothetical protein